MPEALQFDTLISRLAVVEGDEEAEESRQTLDNLLNSANHDLRSRFIQVVSCVTEKVKDNNFMPILLCACIPTDVW